jgi:hypothetical protein
MTEMWEILVPTVHRGTGHPITVEFHRIWDAKVKAITGGLTVMKPSTTGYWRNTEEKTIPVRIACTREQMDEIGRMTRLYYDQEQILAFKISSEVIFYE